MEGTINIIINRLVEYLEGKYYNIQTMDFENNIFWGCQDSFPSCKNMTNTYVSLQNIGEDVDGVVESDDT